MDLQGSTPDTNVGATASPQSSADVQTVPSQPQTPAPQNGDLLGNLQHKAESGEANTGSSADTPSLSTPEQSTPQQTQNQGQQPAGDSADDELTKWASSQNIDLNNPTPEQTKKLAQRLRDTQKWAHERANNNQQFDQIQTALADEMEDPLEREVRELRNQNARRDFWDTHADDRTLEGEMIKKVQDMIQNGNVAGAKYYSTPQGWSDLLDIVKSSKVNVNQIRDDAAEIAARTERENLARVQQASAPNAAATSSAPSAPQDEDAMIAKMSPAEYNEWRKTHNPFSVR